MRGTRMGERIFEAHRALDFERLPLIEVYCGSERVDTMWLPSGRDTTAQPCPLLLEPGRIDLLQKAIAAARERLGANRRWRERRRTLLELRQVRQDLHRLEAYRASGMLSRKWEIFKNADTMFKAGRAMHPDKRRAARRTHLQGLVSHAKGLKDLRQEERRLERRARLLTLLVCHEKCNCSAEGCELK